MNHLFPHNSPNQLIRSLESVIGCLAYGIRVLTTDSHHHQVKIFLYPQTKIHLFHNIAHFFSHFGVSIRHFAIHWYYPR